VKKLDRAVIAAWTFVLALILLFWFLLFTAVGAIASDDGDIGCVTVNVLDSDHRYQAEQVELTDGASFTVVGHYLWLQYAHTPSSLDNVVSTDLTGLKGQQVTLCTTYVSVGTIPTGAGESVRVDAAAPEAPSRVIRTVVSTLSRVIRTVVSTLTPHSQVMDAWITDNGLVAK